MKINVRHLNRRIVKHPVLKLFPIVYCSLVRVRQNLICRNTGTQPHFCNDLELVWEGEFSHNTTQDTQSTQKE